MPVGGKLTKRYCDEYERDAIGQVETIEIPSKKGPS